MMMLLASATVAAATGTPGIACAQGKADIGSEEANEIAVEAYLYLYPLVTMGVTREQTNMLPGATRNSLTNNFVNMRTFPPADFKAVVRSNFDTLYSTAWLDLAGGPMVVSVPDTGGRYYVLPMLDMWTDVFAAPGWRTSGTKAGHFAVVPPGWRGHLPEGVGRIDAPTPAVWIVGRTETNGPGDYAPVHKIQDGYRITPLRAWGRSLAQAAPISAPLHLDAPAPREEVDRMTAFAYFRYAAELMNANPPHFTDWSTVERMKRIGIVPGRSYRPELLGPTIHDALERSVAEGQRAMRARAATLGRIVNGWQMNTETMGVYGDDYLKRAVVAQILLTANQPEDAVYPLLLRDADGKPPVGGNKYVLHFEKNALPPVSAFWSLSMYDAQGFQVANPINRFAIGNRDPLKYNADGSLDLSIQHADPGRERSANWLPAPGGGLLGLTMRLYAPGASVLNGRWAPPPLQRRS